MALRTRLTQKLAIEHPVLLAPMGMVSGGQLARAVSEAGGLGLIGGGYGDATWLQQEFAAAGNQRIGCGFITWSMARDPRLLDLALSHRPAVMMLSFGDPRPFAAAIHNAGSVLICQVQSLDHVRPALDAGAEIIVAQGTEAGGTAGGIADGRGVAAALALGAEGVLVGTRFYATVEALGHDSAKHRIVAASGAQTVRTSVFDAVRGHAWPDGFTGRALRNDFTARWHGRENALTAVLDAEIARYGTAAAQGDVDTAVVFAGEAIDLVNDLPPAAEIVTRLVSGAEHALTAAAARIV